MTLPALRPQRPEERRVVRARYRVPARPPASALTRACRALLALSLISAGLAVLVAAFALSLPR